MSIDLSLRAVWLVTTRTKTLPPTLSCHICLMPNMSQRKDTTHYPDLSRFAGWLTCHHVHGDVSRGCQLRLAGVRASVPPCHRRHDEAGGEILGPHLQVLIVVDHGAVVVPEDVDRGHWSSLNLALQGQLRSLFDVDFAWSGNSRYGFWRMEESNWEGVREISMKSTRAIHSFCRWIVLMYFLCMQTKLSTPSVARIVWIVLFERLKIAFPVELFYVQYFLLIKGP